MFLQVDAREFATILAALRYWQRDGLATDEQGDLAAPGPENDVATDGGTHEPLDLEEIDELCERLNCEPSALTRLVEILRSTATSCHDACTGDWDKSDDGFDALKRAAEEGLTILGAPLPDYGELEEE
jgi:hypothetical protein